MKRFLVCVVLATAGQAPLRDAAADTAPIVLKDLKPGTAVRVKWRNEWVDGKVVQAGESQIQVQIGGSKDWFMADKVWGTEDQQDAEASGGYLDPDVKANFERFKVAVTKLEDAKKSGDAAAVRTAIDEADQVLKRNYGKAGRHPRVGPFLARYWAIATVKVDEIAAEAVAAAEKAAADNDINFFAGYLFGRLDRAQAVVDEFKAFQTTANAETERVDKVMADAKAKIEAAHAKAKLAALEATRLPTEKYKGGDKASLKAKVTAEWKKQFPDRKILKLLIVSDWVQDRSWKTNNSAAGGYWYDWTSITMNLVVKKDATTATVYPVGLSYEKTNKKKLVVGVSDKGFGNYVPYDILLKHVK